MKNKTGPEGPAFSRRACLVRGSASPEPCRLGIARAFAVPGHIRWVLVCLLVDVSHRDDAKDRERDDTGGDSPTAIRFGGDIAIDVVGLGHGRNVIETGSSANG